MTAAVRAKFKVTSHVKTSSAGGVTLDGKSTTYDNYTIKLNPVYGTGDSENAKFYAATPSGELVLNNVKAEVADKLPVGGEFYLDFIPA